jgi:HK97 family phage portal protein
MAVLDGIMSMLTRLVRGTVSATKRTINYFIGTSGSSYIDFDVEKAITKGYEANGIVYAIVNKDATKFASIPQYVYKRVGSNGKPEKIVNDLSELLNNPNEYQGQDAFKCAVKSFKKLTGEAFIWLNRGDVRERYDKLTDSFIIRTDEEIALLPVKEMYVIPSNRVYIIPDPQNVFGVLSYEFDLGGRRLPIRKVDVIHWKNLNMCYDSYTRQHLRGMTPFKPGSKILQQNNVATESSVRMHENDGARGLLFNEDYADLDPIQKSDLKDIANNQVNNSEIKGSIAMVQGKWGYESFGGTAVDRELLASQEFSIKQLCMLLSMPHEFFIDTVYENKEKAMKGWIYNDVIPESKQYDDELNRLLLQAFGLKYPDYFIKSDFSELPELQKDFTQLVNQLNLSWWLTPNEKREAMNYEIISDKRFNEPWVPSGIVPLSESSLDDGFNDIVNGINNNNP